MNSLLILTMADNRDDKLVGLKHDCGPEKGGDVETSPSLASCEPCPTQTPGPDRVGCLQSSPVGPRWRPDSLFINCEPKSSPKVSVRLLSPFGISHRLVAPRLCLTQAIVDIGTIGAWFFHYVCRFIYERIHLERWPPRTSCTCQMHMCPLIAHGQPLRVGGGW
jgi:hypothetical protein